MSSVRRRCDCEVEREREGRERERERDKEILQVLVDETTHNRQRLNENEDTRESRDAARSIASERPLTSVSTRRAIVDD